MYTSVFILVSCAILECCLCLYKNTGPNKIVSKTRTPLEPLYIPCLLQDILIISAPVVGGKKALYYLYNPKGDVRKLKLQPPHYKGKLLKYELISVKSINRTKIIAPMYNYKVFNVNQGVASDLPVTEDVFAEKEKEMSENDFMIGPLGEDDYGNWILSVFYKDHGDWVEVYQVITIDIIETVPIRPARPVLKLGETFKLGFAYPIPKLESCQLIVPKTTFDRFYDRSHFDINTCGYIVTNVTKADAGLWRIIGVGRITYEAQVNLNITS